MGNADTALLNLIKGFDMVDCNILLELFASYKLIVEDKQSTLIIITGGVPQALCWSVFNNLTRILLIVDDSILTL